MSEIKDVKDVVRENEDVKDVVSYMRLSKMRCG